jgi:hypothetical protein
MACNWTHISSKKLHDRLHLVLFQDDTWLEIDLAVCNVSFKEYHVLAILWFCTCLNDCKGNGRL